MKNTVAMGETEVVFRSEIQNVLDALGLIKLHAAEESEKKANELLCFVAMMLKWNQTYNLTALKTTQEILKQHIFDSLAVLPAIRHYLNEKQIIAPRIVDVGSGAGLPGVVLALMDQNYNVTCVDAVEKKVSFLRAVKAQMNLNNLTAHHARIEKMEPLQADVVISRAFASLTDFVQLGHKHIVSGGAMVAMKSKQVALEIAKFEQQARLLSVKKVEHVSVPNNKTTRCLIWL